MVVNIVDSAEDLSDGLGREDHHTAEEQVVDGNEIARLRTPEDNVDNVLRIFLIVWSQVLAPFMFLFRIIEQSYLQNDGKVYDSFVLTSLFLLVRAAFHAHWSECVGSVRDLALDTRLGTLLVLLWLPVDWSVMLMGAGLVLMSWILLCTAIQDTMIISDTQPQHDNKAIEPSATLFAFATTTAATWVDSYVDLEASILQQVYDNWWALHLVYVDCRPREMQPDLLVGIIVFDFIGAIQHAAIANGIVAVFGLLSAGSTSDEVSEAPLLWYLLLKSLC